MSIFDIFKNTNYQTAKQAEAIRAERIRQEANAMLGHMDPMTAYALSKMIKEMPPRIPVTVYERLEDLARVIPAFVAEAVQCEYYAELMDCFTPEKLKGMAERMFQPYMYKIRRLFVNKGITSYYDKFVSVYYKMIEPMARTKYYGAVMSNITESAHLVYKSAFKDTFKEFELAAELFYVIDALATGLAAAYALFVEKRVKELDRDGEFFRILQNLLKEYGDVGLVSDKSWPLYQDYYWNELGDIDDQSLYACAVAILKNTLALENGLSADEERIINWDLHNYLDISQLQAEFFRWGRRVGESDPELGDKIIIYAILRIQRSVAPDDFLLTLQALDYLEDVQSAYKQSIRRVKNQKLRTKYLNGDFNE